MIRPILSLVACLALAGAAAALAANGHGMTWTKTTKNADGSDRVGCAGCNAYDGDTQCTVGLPVLCIYDSGVPDPSPAAAGFTNGWSEGHLALSTPVVGNTLTSLAGADAVCAQQFGTGWRMAEFHDGDPANGSAGWNFRAWGDLPLGQRFWVSIDDQDANCWDP